MGEVSLLQERMSVEENWMMRNKMQKELREVERLSFASKDAGEPRRVNAASAARGGEKEERSHA